MSSNNPTNSTASSGNETEEEKQDREALEEIQRLQSRLKTPAARNAIGRGTAITTSLGISTPSVLATSPFFIYPTTPIYVRRNLSHAFGNELSDDILPTMARVSSRQQTDKEYEEMHPYHELRPYDLDPAHVPTEATAEMQERLLQRQKIILTDLADNNIADLKIPDYLHYKDNDDFKLFINKFMSHISKIPYSLYVLQNGKLQNPYEVPDINHPILQFHNSQKLEQLFVFIKSGIKKYQDKMHGSIWSWLNQAISKHSMYGQFQVSCKDEDFHGLW
eukprot:CAMPEP_0182437490 /NCGR_PEP_ID=MMETSP1167-20130531/85082_1 /TAXON_ID=2988 /ORGANISM="Mallomonas Sp, Strain CCMP3275" /LENGTH=276 /DNA_ID=CAMNT_0024630429 /DNA_START=534 /DNA_END=1361 /DNA_ORIENTATION=+